MSDIQVRGPKGCAKTLSFGGETFTADKKGVFTVPNEAGEHLRHHGFTVEDEPGETDEQRAAREAAEKEAAEAAEKAATEAAAAAAKGGQPS